MRALGVVGSLSGACSWGLGRSKGSQAPREAGSSVCFGNVTMFPSMKPGSGKQLSSLQAPRQGQETRGEGQMQSCLEASPFRQRQAPTCPSWAPHQQARVRAGLLPFPTSRLRAFILHLWLGMESGVPTYGVNHKLVLMALWAQMGQGLSIPGRRDSCGTWGPGLLGAGGTLASCGWVENK